MPELDYALVADYVRADGGAAHAMGAGIDTVYAPGVPTGQNVGLLVRLKFSRTECGRPHRVEVIFQDEDGGRLAEINGVVTPEWDEGLPASWSKNEGLALNIGVPLPRYGLYSFEILLNDSLVKSLPLRVLPAQALQQQGD